MLLSNEVCGKQIGSWTADCLLLKLQKVDLEPLSNILETVDRITMVIFNTSQVIYDKVPLNLI